MRRTAGNRWRVEQRLAYIFRILNRNDMRLSVNKLRRLVAMPLLLDFKRVHEGARQRQPFRDQFLLESSVFESSNGRHIRFHAIG